MDAPTEIVSCRHSGTNTYEFVHEKICKGSCRKVSSIRRASRHSVLPLTKKLLVTDSCWQREKVFSNELLLGLSKTLPGRLHAGSNRPTQNELCLWTSFVVCFFVLFFVCLDFLFRKNMRKN